MPLENMKATLLKVEHNPNQVSFHHVYATPFTYFDSMFKAWSISLHPSGISYAASGASGNITIHSADTSTFGDVLSTLSSGRSKFGLACAYVRMSFFIRSFSSHSKAQSPDGTRIALSSETGQVYVFDLASNTLISTYTSHAMAVRKLSWSPDSQVRVAAWNSCSYILIRNSILAPHHCIRR
jgi:WD40 repeat protein